MSNPWFPASEFAHRREKIYDAIGDSAVAVMQGADVSASMSRFRQYNEFYYLTGIEVSHAYLVMDGRRRETTLLLPRDSQIQKEHDDPVPSVDNPELALAISGADRVWPVESLGRCLNGVEVVYTPFKAGQAGGASYGSLNGWNERVAADPWDGRLCRARHFIDLLGRRCPGLRFKDLLPAIIKMRMVKSPREVDLCRRAGQLSAIGICEAMRSTQPGVTEFQLDGVMQYHYVAGGARGFAYPAIMASGANAWHGHYNANQSVLADGEWVLGDCAPDYHYYTSDIGRMWPVNGTYSQGQRELYGFVVDYHKVLLAGIRPGRTYEEIAAEASEAMRAEAAKREFCKPIYKAACETMCDFPYHLSHAVGMCVHEASPRQMPLEVGMVFSVDPQMKVPEERLYIRCEDTVVITEDGYENFTADAPLELDDVEKMMAEPGLLQGFAPLSW